MRRQRAPTYDIPALPRAAGQWPLLRACLVSVRIPRVQEGGRTRAGCLRVSELTALGCSTSPGRESCAPQVYRRHWKFFTGWGQANPDESTADRRVEWQTQSWKLIRYKLRGSFEYPMLKPFVLFCAVVSEYHGAGGRRGDGRGEGKDESRVIRGVLESNDYVSPSRFRYHPVFLSW